MRVLNIEDNIYKHMEIKRALEWCGIMDVDLVENQEAGFKQIYKSIQSNFPYDLIITDMHYPLAKGKISDTKAGFKLIERLKLENIDIPVIICSSIKYEVSEILGTVWYNESRDLKYDLKEIISRM